MTSGGHGWSLEIDNEAIFDIFLKALKLIKHLSCEKFKESSTPISESSLSIVYPSFPRLRFAYLTPFTKDDPSRLRSLQLTFDSKNMVCVPLTKDMEDSSPPPLVRLGEEECPLPKQEFLYFEEH